MCRRTTFLTWTAVALLSQVSALKIHQYGGSRCSSTPLGTSEIELGKCYKVVGNAESAILEIDRPIDYEYGAYFYTDDKCGSPDPAQGNTGCIDFTAFEGNVLSYKVLDLSDEQVSVPPAQPTSRIKRGSNAKPWDSDAQHYRDLLGLSANDATGSLHPDWDPYAHVNAGFGHGSVTETWGEKWKWQQVALGISIGIPVDEWDDDIHKSSDKFIMFGEKDYHKMLQKRWTSDNPQHSESLEKRWNFNKCRALVTCTKNFFEANGLTLGGGWQQTVNAWYAAKNAPSTLYDWGKNHPITVGVVWTGANTLIGYGLGRTGGGATASDNDQLGDCSNDTTQKQAFIDALVVAANTSTNNAATVVITLENGDKLQISAAVFPKDKIPSKDQVCGAN